MKNFVALALVASAVLPASMPVQALTIEELVRTNCTKQIVSSTDVSRNAIKTFRVDKHGDGFQMIGQNEEQQTVTCETADDGRVTWVRVG